MNRKLFLLLLLAGVVPIGVVAEYHGQWLARVPAQDRSQSNPMATDPSAVAAGKILFEQHCASCHGADARGTGRRPSLHTSRVHQATDGELQWLLRNGSLIHGMPAWSSLPEVQ